MTAWHSFTHGESLHYGCSLVGASTIIISRLLSAVILGHVAFTWARAIRRGAQARAAVADLSVRGQYPPVSILVPAWRERGTVERCIRSLQELTYPIWEAIVLAGGPDATYEAVLDATAGDERFRVFRREPGPKNDALRRGVEAARYDILVLLDADCVVAPHWLDVLVAPLTSGAAASLGDRLPSRQTWVTLAEQMENIQAYHILGSTSIQGDRSMAVRRAALQRAGGLPSETYAREDWDLGVRLIATGEKIVFARGAHVLADRPMTLREFWHNEVRWRRTHLGGLWEHRRELLRRPTWVASQFYFYGLSVALGLGALAAIGLAIAMPAARPAVAKAGALTAVWLAGRRATLGAEVAIYSRDPVWLWRIWGPVVLMFVSFPAALTALLSARRWHQIPLYKGPRTS